MTTSAATAPRPTDAEQVVAEIRRSLANPDRTRRS